MSLRVRYTNQNGFYTGDSSYAIAWIALGNRTACEAQFLRAFRYMNGLSGTPATATQYNPFQVFKEREQSGGHINFLTGAGGFLQNVIQGYAGWRARDASLDFRPVLPPFAQVVRLVGLHFAGSRFTLEFNETSMSVELLAESDNGRIALSCEQSAISSACWPERHTLRVGGKLSLPLAEFSLVLL